jgi:hypothetical protein
MDVRLETRTSPQQPQAMPDTNQPASPPLRRLLTILLTALLMLVAAMLWLWNGPGAAIVASAPPFAIERQADGSWPAPPEETHGFSVSLNLGTRDSHVVQKSSHSVSNARSARFASQSIAVINMQAGPLADLVARGVIAGLQTDAALRRISYSPSTETQPIGELAPDLVIRLAVGELHEDTIAGNGQTRVTAHASVSDQVARGINDVIASNMAPHQVHLRMQIQCEATIEQGGIITPNAKLLATASDLSSSITKKLLTTFADLREEHGAFPELPAAFFPDYVPFHEATFRPADVYGTNEPHRMIGSWRSRFTANETWWHGTVAGTDKEALARIGKRLETAGFARSNRDSNYDQTFRKGAIEIELLPETRDRLASPATGMAEAENANTSSGTSLFVRYRQRTSDKARRAAIDDVIREETGTDLLTLCMTALNRQQRDQVRTILEARELRDPAHLIARANLRKEAADAEGAAQDLARALCYANTSFDRKQFAKTARKKAEAHDLDINAMVSDKAWLIAAGLIELRTGQDPIEVDVTPESPARFVVASDDIRLTTITVGLKRNKHGEWRGAVRGVGSVDNEQSGISMGRANQQVGSNLFIADFLDAPEDGACRVRVGLR